MKNYSVMREMQIGLLIPNYCCNPEGMMSHKDKKAYRLCDLHDWSFGLGILSND